MRSSRRFSPSPIATLGLCVSVSVAIVACSPGASQSTSPAGPTGAASPTAAAASPTAAAAAPTLTDAWVRLPVGMATMTAAYVTVTGGTQPDAILSASSSVASKVSVHETTTDASGMTGMHPVTRIDVPARAVVKLEPGGYHVMLEGLKAGLAAGQTIDLHLVFEHAGTIDVEAVVRQP